MKITRCTTAEEIAAHEKGGDAADHEKLEKEHAAFKAEHDAMARKHDEVKASHEEFHALLSKVIDMVKKLK